MARIDFHSHVSDKLLYCCRLSRKILASTHPQGLPRTIVITGGEQDLKGLDDLLWTFSKTDFLPHAWLHQEANAIPYLKIDDRPYSRLLLRLHHPRTNHYAHGLGQ